MAPLAVVDVDALSFDDHHDFSALWAKDVHSIASTSQSSTRFPNSWIGEMTGASV